MWTDIASFIEMDRSVERQRLQQLFHRILEDVSDADGSCCCTFCSVVVSYIHKKDATTGRVTSDLSFDRIDSGKRWSAARSWSGLSARSKQLP